MQVRWVDKTPYPMIVVASLSAVPQSCRTPLPNQYLDCMLLAVHTHTLSLSLLHQALFAATHFYTNQLLHKSDFTPKRFNTNQLFDKPPFTQTTLYTNQPLLWACRPKARGAGGMPKAVKQLFPCIPCHVVTMWKTPSALSVCVPIWSSQPLGAANYRRQPLHPPSTYCVTLYWH